MQCNMTAMGLALMYEDWRFKGTPRFFFTQPMQKVDWRSQPLLSIALLLIQQKTIIVRILNSHDGTFTQLSLSVVERTRCR